MDSKPTNRTRRGFTLIELLVVIAIIGLLISITLVATSRALKSAEISSTKFLMNSISNGLDQFHTDFGYYPPLLRDDFEMIPSREVLEVQPNAGELLRDYRYFSMTSLPVYLIGVGRLEPSPLTTGLDPARHDGVEGPGFRDPGADHSWGGALDRTKNNPKKTGRVYEPYVDLGDSESMRSAQLADFGGAGSERLPDGAGGPTQFDRSVPMIVDAWGTPIRYYRPGWPTRNPGDGQTTLDYAPIELINAAAVENGLKPELDPGITNAEYFLLSAGPNGLFAGVRPTGAGGDAARIEFEKMQAGETNTALLNTIDQTAGSLRRMHKMIRDNIRVTP